MFKQFALTFARASMCSVTNNELHFTHCKLEMTTILVHQHFPCRVEVDIDANIPVLC